LTVVRYRRWRPRLTEQRQRFVVTLRSRVAQQTIGRFAITSHAGACPIESRELILRLGITALTQYREHVDRGIEVANANRTTRLV
jgi:hypothetical protein